MTIKDKLKNLTKIAQRRKVLPSDGMERMRRVADAARQVSREIKSGKGQ